MQVFTGRSSEYEDLDFLIDELASSLPSDDELRGGSLGLLICESSLDTDYIADRLGKRFSFPIFGCTSFSIISPSGGFDITATFTVYRHDPPGSFAVSLSQPLTYDNKTKEIEAFCSELTASLGAKPDLIIGFMPNMSGVTVSDFVDVVSRTSGHAPLFGAVAADKVLEAQSKVFFGGKAYTDRVAAAAFLGVSPVMAVANVQSDTSYKRTLAKKTKDNIIYEVSGGSFLDYMKRSGLRTDYDFSSSSAAAIYSASPVIIFDGSAGSDGIPVTHSISDINFKDGSVTLLGNVPEGSEIAICMSSMSDVVASTKNCFVELESKMREGLARGHTYGSLFVSSCAARYLIMSCDSGFEFGFISDSPMLGGLPACGLYAAGEMCPTSISAESGAAFNRAHHNSIALLAF